MARRCVSLGGRPCSNSRKWPASVCWVLSPEIREPLHRDETFQVHYAFEVNGRWWYYTPFASRILQEDCYEQVRVTVARPSTAVQDADRVKAGAE